MAAGTPARSNTCKPSASHTDRLEIVDELMFGEVFGAVESHVFDEMGETELIVVFLEGTGIDEQTKLGPLLGTQVAADVIRQPVVELSFEDLRVDRNELIQRSVGCGDFAAGEVRLRRRRGLG